MLAVRGPALNPRVAERPSSPSPFHYGDLNVRSVGIFGAYALFMRRETGLFLENRQAIRAGGAGRGEKQVTNSLNCLLNHVISRAEDLKILEVFVPRRR